MIMVSLYVAHNMNSQQFSDISDRNFLSLARSYHILQYTDQLRKLVSDVLGCPEVDSLRKYDLYKLINDALLNNHFGERTIKSLLTKEFLRQKVVAAYEIPVLKSRIDFLVLNGYSCSYEIKSGLDNLEKLHKQVNDYRQVFEFNYVVIDTKHLEKGLEIIPQSYGVWMFDRGKKTVIRPAQRNTELNTELQLQLLTKKELNSFFQYTDHKEIFKKYNPDHINTQFKESLRSRYKEKWAFVVENKKEILPMDYQFFFNKNISPSVIYHC